MNRKYIRHLGLALLFWLGLASQPQAGILSYDSDINTWAFSEFGQTGVGNFRNTGLGLGGDGTHTRVGNGVTINGNSSGSWLYYNSENEFTDFWWPWDYQFTVVGAIWSSLDNNADGSIGIDSFYQPMITDATGLNNGDRVNGTFQFAGPWTDRTNTLSYVAAAVPEPSIVALFVAGIAGLGLARRKSRA